MSIELVLKLRDSFQQAADACNEYIEKKAPPEVKYDIKDFEKLPWENLQGSKGPFQRTSKQASNNHEIFQALQTILKEHSGFMHLGDCRYWFDQQNEDIIERYRKYVILLRFFMFGTEHRCRVVFLPCKRI